MTKKLHPEIGPRDIEILTAFDRCPLTPSQLCRLSSTFDSPFRDEHNLRRRLRILADADLIRSWPYAIAGEGRSPRYFKLTRDGFRLLYGANAALPKRRYFQAISPGHHHHTFSLAETIVHLCLAAHNNDCEVLHFARENSVKLVVEPFTLFPDCGFVIRRNDGRTFSFVVELDNGTERIRTSRDVESIERKIRGYDAHQSKYDKFDPSRYLVLFVTTRSKLRLDHMLALASGLVLQPQRKVFIGTDLRTLLDADPFRDAIFSDHRGLKSTIVPMLKRDSYENRPQSVLPNALAVAG